MKQRQDTQKRHLLRWHRPRHDDRLENIRLNNEHIESKILEFSLKKTLDNFEKEFVDDLKKELKFWRIIYDKAKECVKKTGV